MVHRLKRDPVHASRLSHEATRVKETGGDILYLDTAPPF